MNAWDPGRETTPLDRPLDGPVDRSMGGAVDGPLDRPVDRQAPAAAPASRWSFRIGLLSDVGQTRERNEDAMAAFLPYRGEASSARGDALFLVADGMGGHEAGDRASAFVAAAVRDWFTRTAPGEGNGAAGRAGPGHAGAAPGQADAAPGQADAAPGRADHGTGDHGTGDPFTQTLRALLEATNLALVEMARREHLTHGAGSTATVACFQAGWLHVAHVGDTRLYRLRGGELEQLTQDHSWVAEQCRAGLLDEAEAASHPQRHMLTECLGVGADLTVFTATCDVRAGDRLLLCSDGLYGPLDAATLAEVLGTEQDPQQAARRLVALANHQSGPDNITAIVVHVHAAGAGEEPTAGAPSGDASALAVTVPGIAWTGAQGVAPAATAVGGEPDAAPAATPAHGAPEAALAATPAHRARDAAPANPSALRASRVTLLRSLLLAAGVLALLSALLLAERSVRGGAAARDVHLEQTDSQSDPPPSPTSVPEEGTMASPQGRTPGETEP